MDQLLIKREGTRRRSKKGICKPSRPRLIHKPEEWVLGVKTLAGVLSTSFDSLQGSHISALGPGRLALLPVWGAQGSEPPPALWPHSADAPRRTRG